jgi:hypothetical protein
VVLFKWVYHAPLALSILKNKLMFPLITIFEKRVREVLKKFSDTAKKEELSNIFRRSILEKCNFEDNLSEYLSKKFPGTLSSERQLQQEEETSQLGYMDYTQPQLGPSEQQHQRPRGLQPDRLAADQQRGHPASQPAQHAAERFEWEYVDCVSIHPAQRADQQVR